MPTARLYPFQWNWDSAFVAMGWATFRRAARVAGNPQLLKGQWDDGLIPQIVFHAPSDDYFPGPEVWGIDRAPPTSGITQPPVLAPPCAACGAAHATRRGRGRPHRCTQRLTGTSMVAAARDPGDTGLVATLHPWETGMDNSPAWDAALARVPTETTTVIHRRDTSTSMPPPVRAGRSISGSSIWSIRSAGRLGSGADAAASPFRVADIGTNAILLRAERDLLALAARFGTPDDVAAIAARIALKETALPGLWNTALEASLSFDLIAGAALRGGDFGRASCRCSRKRNRGAHRCDGARRCKLGGTCAASWCRPPTGDPSFEPGATGAGRSGRWSTG